MGCGLSGRARWRRRQRLARRRLGRRLGWRLGRRPVACAARVGARGGRQQAWRGQSGRRGCAGWSSKTHRGRYGGSKLRIRSCAGGGVHGGGMCMYWWFGEACEVAQSDELQEATALLAVHAHLPNHLRHRLIPQRRLGLLVRGLERSQRLLQPCTQQHDISPAGRRAGRRAGDLLTLSHGRALHAYHAPAHRRREVYRCRDARPSLGILCRPNHRHAHGRLPHDEAPTTAQKGVAPDSFPLASPLCRLLGKGLKCARKQRRREGGEHASRFWRC